MRQCTGNTVANRSEYDENGVPWTREKKSTYKVQNQAQTMLKMRSFWVRDPKRQKNTRKDDARCCQTRCNPVRERLSWRSITPAWLRKKQRVRPPQIKPKRCCKCAAFGYATPKKTENTRKDICVACQKRCNQLRERVS